MVVAAYYTDEFLTISNLHFLRVDGKEKFRQFIEENPTAKLFSSEQDAEESYKRDLHDLTVSQQNPFQIEKPILNN